MQMSEEKQTILGGTQPSSTNLDQGILDLIQNSKSGSGLEGLLDFESKLTKNEKKLSPSEIKALLERTKKENICNVLKVGKKMIRILVLRGSV